MRTATRWITHDGVEHTSEAAARGHVDRLYGSLLTSLAHAALRVDKYTPMLSFIESNLERFVQLKAIKDDLRVENPEEDRHFEEYNDD